MKLPQDVHTMLLRTLSAITMSLLLATSVIPASAASVIQEANAALKGEGENDIFESVSNVNTNLEGWQLKGKGKMEQTAEGLRLSSDSSENATAISATRADDFVYEADVMITRICKQMLRWSFVQALTAGHRICCKSCPAQAWYASRMPAKGMED